MKLNKKLKIINIGLDKFTKAFSDTDTDYISIDWKPPKISSQLLDKIDYLRNSQKVISANKEAFDRLNNSEPVLRSVQQAKKIVPGMDKKYAIYHAGPPIQWEQMCGPVKGAIVGACIYEGWANTQKEAEQLCANGKIDFSPCHHHSVVGPMAGVLSPSMYVWEVENTAFGNTAYCSLNEGLGKVLRFGAFDSEVITRLKWMEEILGPSLQKAVEAAKTPINVVNITIQALMMGDECHNRNVAATGILLKELSKLFLKVIEDRKLIVELIDFIDSNPHFYLNLSMAACKASADSILSMDNSTILSAMARNGTEIGIRVAGCNNKWYTAPAGIPKGLFFSGYSQEDANLDLGDSTISEIVGIGGFAMASAPAIVKFVGGTTADSIKFTKEMFHITQGLHTRFQMPPMNFSGTPTGIDILKVCDTGIQPFINTGIAHKLPGIGQIGAGLLRAPFRCFEEALQDFKLR